MSYNPLDVKNIGESLYSALSSQPFTPISQVPSFIGAGIYAIFYGGDFSAYRPISRPREDGLEAQPIYVGKAVPAGGRKGLSPLVQVAGDPLFKRIREHASSVRAAVNLDEDDFFVKWLVVEPVWIPLGESIMITHHLPVWNAVLDGFGNHDPGAGRRAGLRSKWDTLHPGRPFAAKFPPHTITGPELEEAVVVHLSR